MNFVTFRKPIRVHAQGHFGDLVLTNTGGGCGDLCGDDAVHAHIEGERGGFVVSLADLRQAVAAIDIEQRHAAEAAERSAQPSGKEQEPK